MLLLLLSLPTWLIATSERYDPFTSPLYWWSWLLFPAAACVATYVRPGGVRLFLWSGVLTVPIAVLVAVVGTVWQDADDGVSFWLIGEMVVAVQIALTLGVALFDLQLRIRGSRTQSRHATSAECRPTT